VAPVRPLRLLALALLAGLVLAAPAWAFDASAGVSYLRTIPEPGIVSARAVGDLLYVSALTGVSIYDVSQPRSPVRIGRLDLPNAQNEDVDVGNGIMLITDDPYGGRGVLHVVDVRNPRRPRVLSRYSTWVPGLLTGFGDVRTRRGGIGHTATCIHDCKWAWLAGSPDGIEVVDLRNPARPRFAGKVPVRHAAGGFGTHDVQVDQSGLAWVAGSRGTAAYDVTDPAHPRLRFHTDNRGEEGPWNNVIHHNSLRISDRTLLVTEEDIRPGCRRAGTFETWELSPGGVARPLDRFGVERDGGARIACSAHYFEHRDGIVAAGFFEQGVRLLRMDDPRRIAQVGYYVAEPAMVWGAMFAGTDPAGEVIYVLDHAKGIDVIELDRAALSEVRRPARPRRSRGRLDVAGLVDDGLEVARRGQRLRIRMAAARLSGPVARNVRLELQLPANIRPLRLPRGARFDRRARRVVFRLPRLRAIAIRTVRARVKRSARIGAPLELIAYGRARGDRFPLSDRWVDRGTIGRRTRRTPRPDATAAAGTAATAATGSLATDAAGTASRRVRAPTGRSRPFGVCLLGAPTSVLRASLR
jgi:hypothetical protein